MFYSSSFARLGKTSSGLIPPIGKADSMAGEIARAANQIVYRYLNDGDMKNTKIKTGSTRIQLSTMRLLTIAPLLKMQHLF